MNNKMLAKKATLEDVNLKIMVWGESGSGKSRFALSSPNPIVVDLEGSTRLYANQFDFYKAEVKKTDNTKDIILVTKYGQCIRFHETDVRSTGRN